MPRISQFWIDFAAGRYELSPAWAVKDLAIAAAERRELAGDHLVAAYAADDAGDDVFEALSMQDWVRLSRERQLEIVGRRRVHRQAA